MEQLPYLAGLVSLRCPVAKKTLQNDSEADIALVSAVGKANIIAAVLAGVLKNKKMLRRSLWILRFSTIF